MTYQNDPNRPNRMRDEGSWTGWIVGGVLAVAVILGIFAMTNRTDNTNAASNNPPATTGSATTGSGTQPANPPAAKPDTPTPTPPARPAAPPR